MASKAAWKKHIVRAGPYSWSGDEPPSEPSVHAKHLEPWLAALLQVEHLNLLIGSGFTLAIANEAGIEALDMNAPELSSDTGSAVLAAAKAKAERSGRGEPNIEDYIGVIVELITGLRILAEAPEPKQQFSKDATPLLEEWRATLETILEAFSEKILRTEWGIRNVLQTSSQKSSEVLRLLSSFLFTFASRASSRERLHVFTTNYDRLVEYGCDVLGLRIVDRFVGQLSPVFRSSRLGVDLHYNPPGIRGEPRYLEGVVRLTKLHGSVDWRHSVDASGIPEICRDGTPFGGHAGQDLPSSPAERLMIYPNPAKDVETLEYPYADLFRDFAAATCQPNTALITYGYGFGDDHINRILRDMLTIPSTHLAIISYDSAKGRIQRFCESVGRNEQFTLLVGSHFGAINNLVEFYLPKPAIDNTTWRMVELLNRRLPRTGPEGEQSSTSDGSEMTE